MPAEIPAYIPTPTGRIHAFRDVNIVQNHNISVTGGTETVRYNMSLGYIHNPGMTTGTQYSRYQMRSNLEVDIKPWITAGMNIYGLSTQATQAPTTQPTEVMWYSATVASIPCPA